MQFSVLSFHDILPAFSQLKWLFLRDHRIQRVAQRKGQTSLFQRVSTNHPQSSFQFVTQISPYSSASTHGSHDFLIVFRLHSGNPLTSEQRYAQKTRSEGVQSLQTESKALLEYAAACTPLIFVLVDHLKWLKRIVIKLNVPTNSPNERISIISSVFSL